MSHIRLPRGQGTVIRCAGCGAESRTGQVYPRDHRAWLRSQGWGRGRLRPTKHHAGTTGQDLCPTCDQQDAAAAERRSRSSGRTAR